MTIVHPGPEATADAATPRSGSALPSSRPCRQLIANIGHDPRYADRARMTHKGSRWAATRAFPWSSVAITHRRTGWAASAFLDHSIEEADALRIIRAWDQLEGELDFSAFDQTDKITKTKTPDGFKTKPTPEVGERLKSVARAALRDGASSRPLADGSSKPGMNQ